MNMSGAAFLHQPPGVFRVEGVAHRQQIQLPGRLEHVDFMLIAQARRFQRAAELAVEPGHGGKIVYAGEADPPALFQKLGMSRSTSTPLSPAITGVSFTCGNTSRRPMS